MIKQFESGLSVLVNGFPVEFLFVERLEDGRFRFLFDADSRELYQFDESALREEVWKYLKTLQRERNTIMKDVQKLNGHTSSKFSIQGDMVLVEIR